MTARRKRRAEADGWSKKGRRRQAAGRGASRAGGTYEGHERHRREAMARCEGRCGHKGTKPTSGGGCEGKAKGGRVGRGDGDPELRKPTEAEEGYGVDASAGTGAHTGAETARGLQGGAGGLGVRVEVVRAARSASSGFSRFSSHAGAAGCLRGGRSRASGVGRDERAASLT